MVAAPAFVLRFFPPRRPGSVGLGGEVLFPVGLSLEGRHDSGGVVGGVVLALRPEVCSLEVLAGLGHGFGVGLFVALVQLVLLSLWWLWCWPWVEAEAFESALDVGDDELVFAFLFPEEVDFHF